uniref:NADP-dependent oxidoreductase domain-containing protein n=1 Tax=viral metagenome TaxID=1070528 RepID=A0A6C0J1H4_9ZZZZ
MSLPLIGFGTWVDLEGGETVQLIEPATKEALRVGYRHFDLALNYGTEPFVLSAVKDSKIARGQLFLTDKAHSIPSVERVQTLVEDGQIDYYDLFLLHSPPRLTEPAFSQRLLEEWKNANKLLESGLVRRIGVSNFYQHQLERLLELCEEEGLVQPSANELEIHPFNQEYPLVNFCQAHQIAVISHSPLGGLASRFILQAPIIQQIAQELGSSPAQAVLAMTMSRNIAVIPRSITPARIQENFDSLQFVSKVTESQREALKSLDAMTPMTQTAYASKEADLRLAQ